MERANEILEKAMDIINGARRETYGSAQESFERIANYWNNYMQGREKITGHDVAMMMSLMKIARQHNNHHQDNLVDLAGYAALAALLTDKEPTEEEAVKISEKLKKASKESLDKIFSDVLTFGVGVGVQDEDTPRWLDFMGLIKSGDLEHTDDVEECRMTEKLTEALQDIGRNLFDAAPRIAKHIKEITEKGLIPKSQIRLGVQINATAPCKKCLEGKVGDLLNHTKDTIRKGAAQGKRRGKN